MGKNLINTENNIHGLFLRYAGHIDPNLTFKAFLTLFGFEKEAKEIIRMKENDK